MKVIICGAGQVGWQIARHLSGEKNDVTVVDVNAELVRRATETLDVQGVVGFASHPDVLARAGARDADMIIAATHSDEVNMVCCQIAQSAFNVTRKIARIRAQEYLDTAYSDLYNMDRLAIDVVISPEREVAEAALQRLAAPATFDTEMFMGGRAQLLGIQLSGDCPVLNTPLRQLNELFPTLRAIVVAKALETRTERTRAKIIEKNRATAERAADALERTIVLYGDGMDMDLLMEASIDRADAVLAVTDDDKTNLLVAVRAKQAGCRLAIALVNDPTLAPLMSALDIDAYINPRATTVSSILRHIRHGRVRGVYSIGDAEAELIEAQVMTTSPMSGRLVREIEFPEGVLVGAVMKGDKVMKPTGDLRIEAGDLIAMFAMTKDVPEVERLLQVSIDFF